MLGAVAAECNPQVLKAKVLSESLALECYGCRRTLQHALHGKPVAELIEAVAFVFNIESLCFVVGAYQ